MLPNCTKIELPRAWKSEPESDRLIQAVIGEVNQTPRSTAPSSLAKLTKISYEKGSLALKKLDPVLENCPVLKDVTIDYLSISYASKDDGELGALVAPGFKIKKGTFT